MAFKELSQVEVDHLLDAGRVGFHANGEGYLVPLGFARHQDALYAMTTRGRKTRMAAASPNVSFQIDTSAATGLFTWHSVSGAKSSLIPRSSRRSLPFSFPGSRTCRTGCSPSTRRSKRRGTSSSCAFDRRG
jgi:hypothetical protein